jgi:hypothetical protein
LHRVRTPLERAGLWAPLRALAIWLGT